MNKITAKDILNFFNSNTKLRRLEDMLDPLHIGIYNAYAEVWTKIHLFKDTQLEYYSFEKGECFYTPGKDSIFIPGKVFGMESGCYVMQYHDILHQLCNIGLLEEVPNAYGNQSQYRVKLLW